MLGPCMQRPHCLPNLYHVRIISNKNIWFLAGFYTLKYLLYCSKTTQNFNYNYSSEHDITEMIFRLYLAVFIQF